MRIRDLFKDISEQDLIDWKASASLCKSSKPDSALGSSALASCKSQGLRARQTGKTQLNKSTGKREKIGGKKKTSGEGPGQVSQTRTG